MSQNIFQELQAKKQRLIAVAKQAVEYGWIPQHKSATADKDAISYDEIIEKLETDTLTIGVIGQMKCGKSTFLNAFVFEDDVLPAATTPMTAALSVITYGEKEHVVAEFYTADEWAEQQMQAKRSIEDAADALDESKIKAAKELVGKATKLGSDLDKYLGKTQEDSFSNLIEYVGADGKYISITKSVTIYYPKEYLKGVEIVDTPGFNDPIVSREERTKAFLKKADVVLMMLYAGRPFDATDRDIIFKHVRQCGIGKVLVGINKYDIPFCSPLNPETEEQIKDYVKAEIRKVCRECSDDTLVEILSEVEPIALSAEMALLSGLPMAKVSQSDALQDAWNRHTTNFGIGTQQELRKWSHIDDLVGAVKRVINTEKDNILFAKPLNAIVAAGDKLHTENQTALTMANNEIDLLSIPDTEIEEREEQLAKAHRRLSKKIDNLGEDLDSQIQQIVRKGEEELEDLVDASCKQMRSIIETESNRFKGFDTAAKKCEAELTKLATRTLKRATTSLSDKGKRVIQRNVDDFFADTNDIMYKFLPKVETEDIVKELQRKVELAVSNKELFSMGVSSEDEEGIADQIFAFVNVATFRVFELVGNVVTYSETKNKLLGVINDIQGSFDAKPYLETAFAKKDEVIGMVKEAFLKKLIEPLQAKIQEVKAKRDNKEQALEVAKTKVSTLKSAQATIATQLDTIRDLRATL